MMFLQKGVEVMVFNFSCQCMASARNGQTFFPEGPRYKAIKFIIKVT